jgi:outer membrane protein OmpA-like peptidoglycan-associated protein
MILCKLCAAQNYSLYFASSSFELSDESKATIKNLAVKMKSALSYRLTIKGFCDSTGNAGFNDALSENRAKAVAQEFRKFDINVAEQKGFGTAMPVASNSTEDGKAKNRRAEISLKLEEKKPEIVVAVDPVEESAAPLPAADFDFANPDAQLKKGNILRLRNLNFVGGTSQLLPEAEPVLIELLKIMKAKPELEIEIEGHVCCANDFMLSRERAIKVYYYLVKNGVDEKRLSYRAHSNSMPIAEEATEEGRKANRRVEIKIVKV